jgi:hypothetical protein
VAVDQQRASPGITVADMVAGHISLVTSSIARS